MSVKTFLQIIFIFFLGLVFYLIFFENGKTCGGISGQLIEKHCFPGLFYCSKASPDPDVEGACHWTNFEQYLPSGKLE